MRGCSLDGPVRSWNISHEGKLELEDVDRAVDKAIRVDLDKDTLQTLERELYAAGD